MGGRGGRSDISRVESSTDGLDHVSGVIDRFSRILCGRLPAREKSFV